MELPVLALAAAAVLLSTSAQAASTRLLCQGDESGERAVFELQIDGQVILYNGKPTSHVHIADDSITFNIESSTGERALDALGSLGLSELRRSKETQINVSRTTGLFHGYDRSGVCHKINPGQKLF